MGGAKRFLGAVLAVLALMTSLAVTPVYADDAVSFGGKDVAADDKVYLGMGDGNPILWDVEGASGGSLAVHSHHILFYAQIHEYSRVAEVGELTLETSQLYTSRLRDFKNNAFSDSERALTGDFALSGYFGTATDLDGGESDYWISGPLFKHSWNGEDWWWGRLVYDNGAYVDSTLGVCPASSFNLTSVLFTSAAEGGKSGAAGAGEFAALSGASSVSAWRFTLLDSSRTVTASATGTTAAAGYNSWTVPVTFSGGGTGAGDYVSAILCDGEGNAICYGTVAAGSASGTQEMAMPAGLGAGTYTLRVFSEQRNGDFRTDYAGPFVDIELTVEGPATTTHTVTFVGDGGVELSSAEYAEGTKAADVQVPADPSKPSTAQCDYTFAGWSPEVADVTADATYTATYTETPRSYDITFDLAGGTLDGKTGTVTRTCAYGSTITLPEPTREGYVFQYWEGSRHDAGDEYKVEGAHAFTAVWEEVPATTFTVTFDANGHGTAPAVQTVEDGGRAAKPADPTADGWEFGGWYTDSACTTAYDFSRPVTSDVTLYAKWTKVERPTPVIPRTGDPYQWASGASLAAMTVFGAFLVIAGTALGRRRGQR